MTRDDNSPAKRWQRVARALDRAFEGADEPRAALKRELSDDPDLLALALESLSGDDGANVARRSPGLLAELGGSMDDREDRRWTDRRLGAYRVIGPLGRGGMGAVFLAERADGQFQRQVAVKMLPWSARSKALEQRFAEERCILAGLDHPNIARLLDGGIADDGSPYLVIEYVDGEPIDRYCRENGLGLDRRLDLFLTVCDAVRFAHRNLVVHRDLKPANILVTADGMVKLLDFGIAKLLDPDTGDAPTAGMNFLTPDYAAPEQLTGDPVTTATDVYALGVLLYRLLAGRVPLALSDRSIAEVVEAVCHTQPPTLAAAAHSQKAPPADPRLLRGDLSAIAAQAMNKDPAQRYDSVSALAADLRRHRDGLPVLAHVDTLRYRAAKFLRRHRLGLAAATALFLLMSALTATALWQAHERDVAARRASTVSEFLVSLFEAADPARSQGDTITARELFERGVAKVRRELADTPAVRADVLLTLATIAERLGEHDRGMALVRESLELRRSLYGPDSPETADALRRRGTLQVLEGELDAARSSLAEALGIHRDRGRSAEVALDLEELASLELTRDDPDAASARLEEAIALRRSLDPADARLPVAQGQLAMARRQQGRLQEADALYREALPSLREKLGTQHPETVAAETNFAALLGHQGRYAEAADRFRHLVEVNRELYSADHPQVITARNNLAAMLARQEKHEPAAAEFEALLEYWRERAGADHPRALGTQLNLAAMLKHLDELDRSHDLYRDALPRIESVFGTGHPYVAVTLGHLADIAKARGELDKADKLAREALSIRRASRGEQHPAVAASLHQLGDISLAREMQDEARSFYARAWELRRAELGPDHPETRATRTALERMGATPGAQLD